MTPILLLTLHIIFVSSMADVQYPDSTTLMKLKAGIDPQNKLPWTHGSDPCTWAGVKECMRGRVTKLVVENYGLTGYIDGSVLARLDQLRVLSFKSNNISRQIPNTFSKLVNLKSLYLNNNGFTGRFPTSLTSLHRLKIIVLSNNNLSGEIPPSIVNLPRLYSLYLENNKFAGQIPALNQTTLKFLNVSGNRLRGTVPATTALLQFNASSFASNVDLCGPQVGLECSPTGPAMSPALSILPSSPTKSPRHKSLSHRSKILLIAITCGVAFLIIVCLSLALLLRKRRRSASDTAHPKDAPLPTDAGAEPAAGGAGEREKGEPSSEAKTSDRRGGGGGFSWEGERLGKLVFIGDEAMNYSLEDLLKASAETLGRGSVGSTYKAVMESGYIVTVKRLKDARYPKMEEFRAKVEVLGKLSHPNLVPLRAYFQAKEERLLVFDYFPNGSLFSLIHGNRPSGGGKPLHWTSCLKIAEDLATGLLYIHQCSGIVHGNLKSSNVLLGSDFESCLTDYGLHSFRNPESTDEPSAASLFYRAPECRDPRRPPHQPADVYSFGVLLLELMTGKTPFQDLVQEHGTDIPKWVRSVREEETESGEGSSGNETSEEKLRALLNIAMACVDVVPDNRPHMKEVLKMIRDTRAEAQVSSNNSSDHSPGRWSDTVQSLPREEQSSI